MHGPLSHSDRLSSKIQNSDNQLALRRLLHGWLRTPALPESARVERHDRNCIAYLFNPRSAATGLLGHHSRDSMCVLKNFVAEDHACSF